MQEQTEASYTRGTTCGSNFHSSGLLAEGPGRLQTPAIIIICKKKQVLWLNEKGREPKEGK